MRSGDAIMPGELVFVQEAPGVPEAQRNAREHRRQHAPAPQASRDWCAIEVSYAKVCQTQPRCGSGKYQECILVCGPQNGYQCCYDLQRQFPLLNWTIEPKESVPEYR